MVASMALGFVLLAQIYHLVSFIMAMVAMVVGMVEIISCDGIGW